MKKNLLLFFRASFSFFFYIGDDDNSLKNVRSRFCAQISASAYRWMVVTFSRVRENWIKWIISFQSYCLNNSKINSLCLFLIYVCCVAQLKCCAFNFNEEWSLTFRIIESSPSVWQSSMFISSKWLSLINSSLKIHISFLLLWTSSQTWVIDG